MINWTMLAANSLWIVGLSVLLAAFSYRSYIRSLYKDAARTAGVPGQIQGDVSGSEPYFRLGMVLFVLGQVAVSALSDEAWWRILLWTVLLILLLVEPGVALWHNRARIASQLSRATGRAPGEAVNPTVVADRWKITVVLLAALLQGGIYLFVMPPFQHYDEPSHFEYAWLLANAEEGPITREDRDLTLSRETSAAMLANDFYWNLGRPNLLTDRPFSLGYDQFDNRPLYYRLAAVPLGLFSHLDIDSQLRLARVVSLLFFLLSILAAAGTMSALLPPGHPLRWAIPLSLALLPPFADIMTALNNDAGAFALFTLFLWGSVHMIRRGITPLSASWVILAGLAAFLTKNTALMSLPLIPVAFVMAWWRQQEWGWRWLGLGAGMALLLGFLVTVQGNDARYWYHWDSWGQQTIQTIPSRARTAETTLAASVSRPAMGPVGEFAVSVPLDPAARYHRLLNPLPWPTVEATAGMTVTIGGWFWTDAPLDETSTTGLRVAGPTLLLSRAGTRSFDTISLPITVTNTPTFHAITARLPEDTGVSYYALLGDPGTGTVTEPAHLFLDGAVIALGSYPAEQSPQFADNLGAEGIWGGVPFANLVRNGSASQSWPRIRPQAENLIFRAAQRSPTLILNGLLDWPRNGNLLGRIVPQHLLIGLMGYFAWGHVRLQGDLWLPLYYAVLALALAGTGWWVVRMIQQTFTASKRRRRSSSSSSEKGGEDVPRERTSGEKRSKRRRSHRKKGVVPGVIFLGLSGFLVWTNAVLWVVTNMWIAQFTMPSTRYTFPAALPTVLLTVAGIAALAASNRRVQRWVIVGMVAAFFVLNLVGLHTIVDFYANLPV